ncbi:hypothetical protein [Streptomyces sp. NPDC019539]|uniref:hypothetical protein n=1 Tax=Streptomyces sp. NPDC019539 TaxID=3365063 RepID=UPI0037904269
MEECTCGQPNIAKSSEAEAAPAAVDDQLLNEFVARGQSEGLQLTGEGGLLQQLTKRLLESALEGENLGYDRHDPAGKNGGNSHNGKRSKTLAGRAARVPSTGCES